MSRKKAIPRLWTLEELGILLDMMKKGSKLKDIAERLNRSYGSIQVKVKSMGKDLWEVAGVDISQKGLEIIGLMKSYMMQSLCLNVEEHLLRRQKRHHTVAEHLQVR